MTFSVEDRRLLRMQFVLGGLGAVVWYAGVLLTSDFAAGIGVGMLVAALSLRLLKDRSRTE